MINKNFYPTPILLIRKMLEGVDIDKIETILEPSAGKGDIVDYIIKQDIYSRNLKTKIDCIELDTELQATLKGKGYRVVHNDFLSFETHKKYDLIVMNPPFDNGEQHLLKALKLQENGGAIICLLNAETIKNPYSNARSELVRLLENYDAQIEFIENAFINAERQTKVEVVLIKVLIPKKEFECNFLNELRQEEKFEEIFDTSSTELTRFVEQNQYIETAVEQYNLEVKLGIKLIQEYNSMKPYIKQKILKEGEKDFNSSEILTLFVGGEYSSDRRVASINEYVKKVRYKYWEALFNNPKFVIKLTSNLVSQLWNKLNELQNYDFSIWNIMTIQEEMMKNTIKGVEQTILDLFEELSVKYAYYDETSKNIHYYNGWKTNKAFKINKKVIVPYLRGNWEGRKKLTDIQKIFDYLDKGQTSDVVVEEVLKLYSRKWNDIETGVKIPLKYFMVTFYKKGTCHIEFLNIDLLEKFNLFGSQRKGWLPPNYGKKKYSEMSKEEIEIVKEFSGSEENYNKIFNKQDYFIVNNNDLLLLA